MNTFNSMGSNLDYATIEEYNNQIKSKNILCESKSGFTHTNKSIYYLT